METKKKDVSQFDDGDEEIFYEPSKIEKAINILLCRYVHLQLVQI
jgi:hypothetical protein